MVRRINGQMRVWHLGTSQISRFIDIGESKLFSSVLWVCGHLLKSAQSDKSAKIRDSDERTDVRTTVLIYQDGRKFSKRWQT